MNAKTIIGVLALPVALLLQPLAGAQTNATGNYPSRAVRVVVPAPPGGANDIIGRIVTTKLVENTGQPWVVDNRPGASGNIAVEMVVRAPADGYTTHIGNAITYITNQYVFKGLSFNAM